MSDPRDQLQANLADRYVLERELGRGGMATVYLARDLKHDRSVALKVLHPELAHVLGPDRFQREIKHHPHRQRRAFVGLVALGTHRGYRLMAHSLVPPTRGKFPPR